MSEGRGWDVLRVTSSGAGCVGSGIIGGVDVGVNWQGHAGTVGVQVVDRAWEVDA